MTWTTCAHHAARGAATGGPVRLSIRLTIGERPGSRSRRMQAADLAVSERDFPKQVIGLPRRWDGS